MSKLKENIDRILGSSLRCLLPSYWWKRIFGFLVEEINDVRSTANSKANKSEVTSLSNSVDALSDKVDKIDSGNNITVDSELSLESTNPVQNKVVTTEIIKRKGCTCYVTDKYTGSEYEEVVKRNVEAYSAWLLSAQLGSLDTWSILNESWGNNLYTAQKVTYSFYNILMYVLVEGNIEIYKLSNDGTCVYVGKESPSSAGGLETRSFKSTNSTTDKEWNRNTVNLFLEGKANIVYSFNNAGLPEGTGGELMLNAHIYQDGNHRFCFFEQHPSGGYTDHGIIIQSDGTYDDDVEVFKPSTEMSDTSTNTVQNKVVKKYVDDTVKTYELNLVNLNTFDKIEAAIAALNLPDSVDITRQLKITDNYAGHLIVKSDLYPLANISASVITFNCMQGLRIIAKKEDQSVSRIMVSDATIHIGTTDGNYNTNNTAIFPSIGKDPTESFADFNIHYHTKDNTYIKCRPLNVLRGYETSEEEPTYYQFDVIVNGCRETWRVNSDGSCICEKVANMDIDTALSDSSTNPVQNKVIKAYVDEAIATSITNALNTEV